MTEPRGAPAADPGIDALLALCDAAYDEVRRLGAVHDEARMQDIIDRLHALGPVYADVPTVPKALAGVLFDLSTALYSAVDTADEARCQAAFAWFDEFCEAARGVLN